MMDDNASVADPRLDAPQEEAYRTPSVLAVLALGLGLLSPLAFLNPVFWTVPAAAAVAGLLALRRIAASDGALAGRGLALAALALALFSAAGAITHRATRYARLEAEADEVARQFCAALAADDVPGAHQLTLPAPERAPPGRADWTWYLRSHLSRTGIRDFVKRPPVRSLLALGPQAQVRHYYTEKWDPSATGDRLELVYAVSYTEDGHLKTIFVRIDMLRSGGVWQVVGTDAPYRPKILAEPL
jgi:hypothetical protein